MTMNQEIELKFTLANQAYFNDPEQLLCRAGLCDAVGVDPPQTITHVDGYLDDDNLCLMRHGYSLRLRASRGEWRMAAKSVASRVSRAATAGLLERLEIEAPICSVAQAFDPVCWPIQIRNLLTDYLAADFRPELLVVLEQQRHKRLVTVPHVTSAKSGFLAEFSADKVQVLPPPAGQRLPAPADCKPVATFLELEIEQLSGTGHVLDDVATRLLALSGITPVATSKFQRALALLAQSAGSRPGQEMPHDAVACQYLRPPAGDA